MRRPLLTFAALSIATAGTVLAAARRPPAPPAPPPGPPPAVALSVDAAGDGAWRVRVENTGTLPLRLTADVRLLSLELRSPSGGTVTCALPEDMRPATDMENALLLPPGRAWVARFDPRLYCFGAKEAAALAGGDAVPRMGWSPGKAVAAPFVVAPPPRDPDSSDAAVLWPAPAKMMVGPAFPLPTPPAPVAKPPPPPSTDPFPSRLRVGISPRIDVREAFDVPVVFTLTNEGERPEPIIPHAGTVAIDVQGPAGAVRCALGATPRPVRETLVSLAPRGGRTSFSVLVDRLCPVGTFARAGLYTLTPRLDTRRIGAPPAGMRLFVGEVVGDAALLRVRRGTTPWPAPALAPEGDAGVR